MSDLPCHTLILHANVPTLSEEVVQPRCFLLRHHRMTQYLKKVLSTADGGLRHANRETYISREVVPDAKHPAASAFSAVSCAGEKRSSEMHILLLCDLSRSDLLRALTLPGWIL